MASPVRAAVFYPTSFTLANGLQVVVVPNHLAPAVSQMVWYKVGSTDERPGKTGLAHYLEHLMFRGTLETPTGEFSRIIAAQGGSENAFTSYDYTAYFETVAADRLPLVMQMEADRMQNLHIQAETATPELSVVLDERQQRTDNSPEGRFHEKTLRLLMPHYVYGTPVIGWKKEIEKLSVADADAFYKAHYAPNNAVVVISGDVEPDEVMRLAAAIYGSVPKRDVPVRKALPEPPLPAQKSFTMVDAGVEQPEIERLYVMPSYATQKDDEAYALEVLAEALDGGEVGLLYRHLVNELHLATGTETEFDPDARGDAIFTIAASPATVSGHKKLDEALAQYIAELAEKGVPPEAVSSAKDRLKRSAVFARDSLMMPGYSFGMALTTGHAIADVEAWPAHIDAVTTDQVNAAMRHLNENPHTLAAALLPDAHASAAQREAAHPTLSHDMGIR